MKTWVIGTAPPSHRKGSPFFFRYGFVSSNVGTPSVVEYVSRVTFEFETERSRSRREAEHPPLPAGCGSASWMRNMSNGTPPWDSLTHRLAKLRSAAESIERLAADYLLALRPVREALQAVADSPFADRDRWAGAVGSWRSESTEQTPSEGACEDRSPWPIECGTIRLPRSSDGGHLRNWGSSCMRNKTVRH